ncbi:MAG: GGDEF domain-containing protein [Acidobacteriota bacterium]|jgi:diguanylate cyclase (GGDEF)-like protein|nr:GGDEF domain-containing protein [Acidobacteriota bacterium]
MKLDELVAVLDAPIPGVSRALLDLPHLVCVLLDRNLCVLAANGSPDDPARPVPARGRWLSDMYSTSHIHPVLAQLAESPQAVTLPGRDGAHGLVGHFFSTPQGILFLGELDDPVKQSVLADISRLNDELIRLNRRYRQSRDELALANRRVTELSLTDPLTGLKNRRAIEPLLRREAALVSRHGMDCSLIMMDLDHFKRINDDFGHQTGDDVLTAVGKMIREQMRVEDTCCRWGGEEFMMLLPHAAVTQAKACARRIQAALSDLHIRAMNRALTASFGISQLLGEEDIEAAVRRSDQALYAAKHAGRNRVWIHMPDKTNGGA